MFYHYSTIAHRHGVLTIDCVESVVFVAPDADNLGRHWAVVDTDYCPWHEQYADDDYGDAIRVRPYLTLAPPQAHGGNNNKRKRGSGGAGAGTSSDSDGSAECCRGAL